MFRLFLHRKLLAGDGKSRRRNPKAPVLTPSPQRNRRANERFNVDHKHLTLMNEQDILLVRDISAKGFATILSPRGLERLEIGDVYEARFRYVGEIHPLEAKVAWKDPEAQLVGFTITEAPATTTEFLARLLRPIEIATSLRSIDPAVLAGGQDGKSWLHGDYDTDLFTWREPDTGRIKAWQLRVGPEFVAWSESQGLVTGTYAGGGLAEAARQRGLGEAQALPGAEIRDDQVAPQRRQLAIDILMALPQELGAELMDALSL